MKKTKNEQSFDWFFHLFKDVKQKCQDFKISEKIKSLSCSDFGKEFLKEIAKKLATYIWENKGKIVIVIFEFWDKILK